MLFAALIAATISAPSTVAVSRCNNYVTTSLEDKVRGFDRRPPSAKDRNDRYAALQGITASANEEADILHAVCSDDDYVPIAAQLSAVEAWTQLLEADLNQANYDDKCKAAAQPVARAFVAHAWLLLVKADPEQTGRYPSIQNVLPKAKTRAAALGLTLPTPADTSAYWLTQQQQAADEAIKTCGQ
ncbi:MAG TPA: hypothetical protein VFN49_00085 [Candidatus Aquilonibacter sp.]|nr:hypothetical protein [Candidatus Aquilonibacter sp.]